MPSVEDRATLCVQGRWGHPWLLGEGPPSLRRVLPQCEPPAPDPPTTGPGGPSTLGPEASWTGWLLLLTDPVLLWGQCAVCARALTPGTTTQMHFLAPPEVSDTQGGGNTHLSAWEDLAPPCGRARPACREGSVAQHPHNPAPCPPLLQEPCPRGSPCGPRPSGSGPLALPPSPRPGCCWGEPGWTASWGPSFPISAPSPPSFLGLRASPALVFSSQLKLVFRCPA